MSVHKYTDKVMDHFRNPRNVGTIENPDGYGKVGNPVCGDLMEMFLRIGKNDKGEDIIEDIKFRTFGCGSAVSTSSMVTEMAKGMTLDEAYKITRSDVAEELAPLLYFDMFEAWLNKTTQRKTFDWMRKKGAQKRGGAIKILPIDGKNEDDNPFMNILRSLYPAPEASLLYSEIISAFERLDKKHKRICFLYYVDGYNDREIAETLEMKENTVTKYRLKGARKLQEGLRRMGYE